MMEQLRLVIFLAAVTLLLDRCLGQGNEPVVSTSHGEVRGLKLDVAGTEVQAFLGIPYATPPVGQLRFKKPGPAEPWSDQTLDATQKPVPCVQDAKGLEWIPWIPSDQGVSEDCLYLNVWTPAQKCSQKANCQRRPVMIWIHGGGFYSGASDLDLYDGRQLAASGQVVVASINYRLGIFGFLNAGTDSAPGNMGLLDQNMAIKWIRDNAANFGGDPNNITLFGQSAGAVSVSYHLLSPLSSTLFHRAIMQSGANNHPLLAVDPKLNHIEANEFAKSVKCADDKNNIFSNPQEVVKCLQSLDAQQLAAEEQKILAKSPSTFPPSHGDEFMPQDPITALKSGHINKIPLLIGFNPDEGWPLLAISLPQLVQNSSMSKPVVRSIVTALFKSFPEPVPGKIADFYLNSIEDEASLRLKKSLGDVFGDNVISCPTVFFAKGFSRRMPEVYFYYYTHRTSQLNLPEWMGITHFQECPFVFGDPVRKSANYSEEEVRFSQKIMDIWTTFAKSGKPPSQNEAPWPLFSDQSPDYLELNPTGSSAHSKPGSTRCEFWKQLMPGN